MTAEVNNPNGSDFNGIVIISLGLFYTYTCIRICGYTTELNNVINKCECTRFGYIRFCLFVCLFVVWFDRRKFF